MLLSSQNVRATATEAWHPNPLYYELDSKAKEGRRGVVRVVTRVNNLSRANVSDLGDDHGVVPGAAEPS